MFKIFNPVNIDEYETFYQLLSILNQIVTMVTASKYEAMGNFLVHYYRSFMFDISDFIF